MTTPYNQTRDSYTLYNTTSETPVSPVYSPDSVKNAVEGFDADDVVDLYNSMSVNDETARKYELDRNVSYPSSHPEFAPTEKEIMINDSMQIMNQQYNTMVMTIAATASLGLIAYMVSSNASS